MSWSAYFSLNQKIDDLIRSIIEFYLPKGGTIYDPTCGKENRQFRTWINMSRWDGAVYKYIRSDKESYGDFVFDLFDIPEKKIPLDDSAAHITVYDVPFLPTATVDPRKEDYGLQVERTAKDIAKFFTADIYRELGRVTSQFILVRGQDFYWPPASTNFFRFSKFALEHVEEAGLVERGLYAFRFNRTDLPKFRENLKNWVRPIITHGYVAVIAKPDAMSKRNGAEIKNIIMSPNWDRVVPDKLVEFSLV